MGERGRYAKGVAKRREILEVAMAHYAERGYDRVSVREVARLAGLTQAGLLHHFPNKESLYLAVLAERDSREGGETEAEQRASVTRLVRAVERNQHEPGLVSLFVAMAAEAATIDGPAREFFRVRHDWIRQQLVADIERQLGEGAATHRPGPEAMARLLVAAADGLQAQWLHDPSVDMAGLMTALVESWGLRLDPN